MVVYLTRHQHISSMRKRLSTAIVAAVALGLEFQSDFVYTILTIGWLALFRSSHEG